MLRYSDEIIEEVRQTNDIVDIISQYVHLKRSGRNYFGLCPFHNEKSPSFSVSPDKQIFSCFSCHTAGNVFTFIKEYEHVSFIEAVKMVADIAGINVDIDTSNKKTIKNNDIYKIYKIGQKFYLKLLCQGYRPYKISPVFL